MATYRYASPGGTARRLLLDRRTFVLGAAAALGGCVSQTSEPSVEPIGYAQNRDPYYLRMYGPLPDERFPVPAADISAIEPRYLRQEVDFFGPEGAGTIVVDPDEKFLYLVREERRALRYGVGVGRDGFGWSGEATIGRKAEWPTWTPPAEMIERQPELEKYRYGQEPGLDNPLGARALYLFQGDRDTLYRLHGSREEWSIGRAVSSGCVRLLTQDIVDLYRRVPIGTKVIVRESRGTTGLTA
ncbi:L,D-transpeptidase [Lutibaculum baratangense]|uniref:L,D-TPase catalytic domain-containing protein n=1 Tax=Lutibaculum baratangense AMV1 TaxID=631454 RepID=V4RQD4_9HYPH|nr:L,D-transpeptidase [Lutibaculum baratangense]ESR27459.1 hypothetical protein N177_0063 [Lutibaculum baratangense AMV1]